MTYDDVIDDAWARALGYPSGNGALDGERDIGTESGIGAAVDDGPGTFAAAVDVMVSGIAADAAASPVGEQRTAAQSVRTGSAELRTGLPASAELMAAACFHQTAFAVARMALPAAWTASLVPVDSSAAAPSPAASDLPTSPVPPAGAEPDSLDDRSACSPPVWSPPAEGEAVAVRLPADSVPISSPGQGTAVVLDASMGLAPVSSPTEGEAVAVRLSADSADSAPVSSPAEVATVPRSIDVRIGNEWPAGGEPPMQVRGRPRPGAGRRRPKPGNHRVDAWQRALRGQPFDRPGERPRAVDRTEAPPGRANDGAPRKWRRRDAR